MCRARRSLLNESDAIHPLFGEVDDIAKLPCDVVESFQEAGFGVVRKLLSAELVSTCRRHCDIAVNDATWDPVAIDPYRRAFQYAMNARLRDRVLHRIAIGKRVAQVATVLLRCTGVRLSHDQVLYKPATADGTPTHADQYHWPVSTDATITAWIPLQSTSIDSGALQFYGGSHRLSETDRAWLSTEATNEQADTFLAKRFPLEKITFEMGDVSFHRGWTFHRASANRSSEVRAAYSLVFMEHDIRIIAPRMGVRLELLSNWCPNARVGAALDAERNPIVFLSSHRDGEAQRPLELTGDGQQGTR